MRVFVTGASGFVGSHLVEHLVAKGHEVRAMARSDRSAQAVRSYGATPCAATSMISRASTWPAAKR